MEFGFEESTWVKGLPSEQFPHSPTHYKHSVWACPQVHTTLLSQIIPYYPEDWVSPVLLSTDVHLEVSGLIPRGHHLPLFPCCSFALLF